MAREVGELFQSLEDLKEHVINTFETAGVDLPDRRYIIVGSEEEAAHDCEQLVVSFAQLYNGWPGQPIQEPTKCDSLWVAMVGVSIVRCVPSFAIGRANRGQPATPESITEAAEAQTKDAELLLKAGLTFSEEIWFGGPGGLGDVQAGGISGGYQQVTLTLAYVLP